MLLLLVIHRKNWPPAVLSPCLTKHTAHLLDLSELLQLIQRLWSTGLLADTQSSNWPLMVHQNTGTGRKGVVIFLVTVCWAFLTVVVSHSSHSWSHLWRSRLGWLAHLYAGRRSWWLPLPLRSRFIKPYELEVRRPFQNKSTCARISFLLLHPEKSDI